MDLAAAHLLWDVQRESSALTASLGRWTHCVSALCSHQGQALQGAEVRVFVFHLCEHMLDLLCPCELIIQRSGMMVIAVQWVQ